MSRYRRAPRERTLALRDKKSERAEKREERRRQRRSVESKTAKLPDWATRPEEEPER